MGVEKGVLMVTTAHAAASSPDPRPLDEHTFLRDLLHEAAPLRERDGLATVLDHVTSALDHDTLTPDVAFSLAQQLRLLVGDHPADDDLDAHQLLRTILSELIEAASLVDGVHVDELEPHVAHLLSLGDVDEAQRLTRLAQATRARVNMLERSLALDPT